MNELIARLSADLPPAVADNLLWVTAVAAAGLALALGLLVRNLNDRRREVRPPEDPDDGTALVQALEANRPPRDWAGRMDRSFEAMVRRTGLTIDAQQAVGAIALTGSVVAAGLMAWRGDLWLVGAGLVGGFALALAAFLLLQRRWRLRLQAQLPDALFLLARSLRAGLSLEQAIALVGEQGVKPLADEFRTASEQTRLGLNVLTALQRMADHVRLTDFNVFAAVVTLHRQAGGNLSQLLDRVAATVRDRNLFRGQFKAATALGRTTAVFICAAMPVLLLVYATLQPEVLMRFLSHPAGLTAFAVACTLQVIGIVWIWYLQRVDY
jgi:tight adherence protein B